MNEVQFHIHDHRWRAGVHHYLFSNASLVHFDGEGHFIEERKGGSLKTDGPVPALCGATTGFRYMEFYVHAAGFASPTYWKRDQMCPTCVGEFNTQQDAFLASLDAEVRNSLVRS